MTLRAKLLRKVRRRCFAAEEVKDSGINQPQIHAERAESYLASIRVKSAVLICLAFLAFPRGCPVQQITVLAIVGSRSRSGRVLIQFHSYSIQRPREVLFELPRRQAGEDYSRVYLEQCVVGQ